MENNHQAGRQALPELDFESLQQLAQGDPGAFEALRERVIEQTIAAAPVELRDRLLGLQWRADRLREQAKTPMASCLKMSELMWEAVVGNHGLLKSLQALTHAADRPREPRPRAKVLQFAKPENSTGLDV